MSEAVSLDPIPEETAQAARAAILAMRQSAAGLSEWIRTQSEGPERRRLKMTLNVINRDVLLLEQFLVVR